jgi:hypothetical protein
MAGIKTDRPADRVGLCFELGQTSVKKLAFLLGSL